MKHLMILALIAFTFHANAGDIIQCGSPDSGNFKSMKFDLINQVVTLETASEETLSLPCSQIRPALVGTNSNFDQTFVCDFTEVANFISGGKVSYALIHFDVRLNDGAVLESVYYDLGPSVTANRRFMAVRGNVTHAPGSCRY